MITTNSIQIHHDHMFTFMEIIFVKTLISKLQIIVIQLGIQHQPCNFYFVSKIEEVSKGLCTK